jgi:hypothetical protein
MSHKRIHAHTDGDKLEQISARIKKRNLIFLKQLIEVDDVRSISHGIDKCITLVRKATGEMWDEQKDAIKSLMEQERP